MPQQVQFEVKIARFGYEVHVYSVGEGETVGSLLARPGWQNLPADQELRLNGRPANKNTPVTGIATITVAPKVNGG